MNDAIKRGCNSILESLEKKSGEVSALTDELARMLIRGEDNHVLPPQVRMNVEVLTDAVSNIEESVANICWYVNRKQPTHRL